MRSDGLQGQVRPTGLVHVIVLLKLIVLLTSEMRYCQRRMCSFLCDLLLNVGRTLLNHNVPIRYLGYIKESFAAFDVSTEK